MDSQTGVETVRARRHLTSSEIGLMHAGRDDDFCRIRNISATGLMAQVYRAISAGDEVDVALKCGQSVRGSVIWTAEHVPDLASRSVRQIGVRFDEPIDIELFLSSRFTTQTGAVQRWPRLVAECPLKLVLDSGRQISGRLCDISQRGAKFQTPHGVPGQVRGSLMLRGLPALLGSVRWNEGLRVGMAFDFAIKLESLVQWNQDRRAEAFACRSGPA
ncbi:MAG TPA: PilZ domain-containing protein [Allosphingosinicella sp.]|nr:PilZ domain-containing protein [Allosphingosinicella sp.]